MTGVSSEDLEYILKQSSDSFKFLNNKKIFITGGTGFFGKWILEAIIHANSILNSNISITVLSRNSQKFINNFPHLGLNKNIQLSLGLINSLLLYSKINTSYPYVDNRILQDNISTVNKFLFSIQGGISYKVAKRLGVFFNYQYTISNMIELNSRYAVEEGNKLNIFNIGINILLNK